MATRNELFFYLTCLHTTTFVLLIIFLLAKMITLKIWEKSLSWHAKFTSCIHPLLKNVTCLSSLFSEEHFSESVLLHMLLSSPVPLVVTGDTAD